MTFKTACDLESEFSPHNRPPLTRCRSGRRTRVPVKPPQESPLELRPRRADCAAMIRSRHLPQCQVRVDHCNSAGMANGDVAVLLPVDQKNRNVGRCHGSIRRDLFEVEMVLPPCKTKRDFHHRTQYRSPHPWSGVKELSHAVIGDLAKARNGDSAATAQKRGSVASDSSNCAAPIDSPKPKMQLECWGS